MAAMVAMVAMAAGVTVVGVVDLENADTNLVHELLVTPRPLKELGRGRLKSEQLPVSYFAEELWFIHNGLSLQLTASQVNLPRAFA